jgi:hypothetical protein
LEFVVETEGALTEIPFFCLDVALSYLFLIKALAKVEPELVLFSTPDIRLLPPWPVAGF